MSKRYFIQRPQGSEYVVWEGHNLDEVQGFCLTSVTFSINPDGSLHVDPGTGEFDVQKGGMLNIFADYAYDISSLAISSQEVDNRLYKYNIEEA